MKYWNKNNIKQAAVRSEMAASVELPVAQYRELLELAKEAMIFKPALEEIVKGRGPIDKDPLKHADNCINSMISVAQNALNGIEEEFD